jgi:hypothetical protein
MIVWATMASRVRKAENVVVAGDEDHPWLGGVCLKARVDKEIAWRRRIAYDRR